MADIDHDTRNIFPEMAMISVREPADYYLKGTASDRTLEQYEAAFGFDMGALSGKAVLDLGAGRHGRFVKEANSQGLSVVALNACWSNKEYRDIPPVYENDKEYPKLAVAGLAQNLPFRDNSFDVILSLWGVPAYLPGNRASCYSAFSEIKRVLRPGGVALLFPLHKVMLKIPEYTEVLRDAVGEDYQILNKGVPPKLVITKPGYADSSKFVSFIVKAADRETDSFIW